MTAPQLSRSLACCGFAIAASCIAAVIDGPFAPLLFAIGAGAPIAWAVLGRPEPQVATSEIKAPRAYRRLGSVVMPVPTLAVSIMPRIDVPELALAQLAARSIADEVVRDRPS